MELISQIQDRFSVRRYKNLPVDEKKIHMVLEAARWAPSAVNFQPWKFIVVRNPDSLKKIHSVYPREWIKSAPVIIIACSDHRQSWKRGTDGKDSADIDIAIAVDHMTLQAAALNLGTCWVCNFDVIQCRAQFRIPDYAEPVVLLPLGYPDIEKPVKRRKGLDEIVYYEEFGSINL